MDRLTTWNGSKYILPQGRTSDGESYWRIIADRLAAYENTGLTPEEIEKLKAEKIKEILVIDDNGEVIVSITDTDIIEKDGYTVHFYPDSDESC